MSELRAIEGRIELTPSAVIFHGINRWDASRTIPLGSIASVVVDPGNFGRPARLTISTSAGEAFSRRHGPRNRTQVAAFAAEIEQAIAAR